MKTNKKLHSLILVSATLILFLILVLSTASAASGQSGLSTDIKGMSDNGINQNQEYKIMSMHSGKVADLENGGPVGSRIVQWPYHDGDTQKWRFISLAGNDTGYYQIFVTWDGTCMRSPGIEDKTVVSSKWKGSGLDTQKWKVTKINDKTSSYYKIENKADGMILAVYGASFDDRTQLIVCPWHATENEKWIITPVV